MILLGSKAALPSAILWKVLFWFRAQSCKGMCLTLLPRVAPLISMGRLMVGKLSTCISVWRIGALVWRILIRTVDGEVLMRLPSSVKGLNPAEPAWFHCEKRGEEREQVSEQYFEVFPGTPSTATDRGHSEGGMEQNQRGSMVIAPFFSSSSSTATLHLEEKILSCRKAQNRA